MEKKSYSTLIIVIYYSMTFIHQLVKQVCESENTTCESNKPQGGAPNNDVLPPSLRVLTFWSGHLFYEKVKNKKIFTV